MRWLSRNWRAAALALLAALLGLVSFGMAWVRIYDTGVYLLMGALLSASLVPEAWRRGRDG